MAGIQEFNPLMKKFMEKIEVMLNNSPHQNDIMDRTFKIATCNANGLATFARNFHFQSK